MSFQVYTCTIRTLASLVKPLYVICAYNNMPVRYIASFPGLPKRRPATDCLRMRNIIGYLFLKCPIILNLSRKYRDRQSIESHTQSYLASQRQSCELFSFCSSSIVDFHQS